jgi:alkylation response protein AidB-like acyl-CoA dehydrogenase
MTAASAARTAPAHVDSSEQALDVLKRAIQVSTDTVAPRSAEVDRRGSYPAESMAALAAAGVLGLTSAVEVGGAGASLAVAAQVVEELAGACSSTAMVLLMHYAAVSVIEEHGDRNVREAVARGEHLSTLAFSEAGSRSNFWVPVSTADRDGAGTVSLNAEKSWVTAAGHADSYVWSSRPLAADGPMTLWHVPSGTSGLSVKGDFDGFGLRGNASSPVTGTSVQVPASAMLGADGAGLDIALATALPRFLVLNAAFSLGVTEALLEQAKTHLLGARLAHLAETLADRQPVRDTYARLRTRADTARVFLVDTLTALERGRPDAMLRVLQVKAVVAEAAADIADGVMRLCGGAAFRRGLGIERRFRDALAARVMAPTTEALYDFTGRASLGMPLFGAAS